MVQHPLHQLALALAWEGHLRLPELPKPMHERGQTSMPKGDCDSPMLRKTTLELRLRRPRITRNPPVSFDNRECAARGPLVADGRSLLHACLGLQSPIPGRVQARLRCPTGLEGLHEASLERLDIRRHLLHGGRVAEAREALGRRLLRYHLRVPAYPHLSQGRTQLRVQSQACFSAAGGGWLSNGLSCKKALDPASCGHPASEVGANRTKFGRIRAKNADSGQNLVDSEPMMVDPQQQLVSSGRIRTKFVRSWANLDDVGKHR